MVWQVVLGILDSEHPRERRTPKRRAVRLGFLLNGGLHGVLVGEAAWRLWDSAERLTTAGRRPFGQVGR